MAAPKIPMTVKITKGKELDDGTKTGWPRKGLGRWIYCSYCYKHVSPGYFEEEMLFADKLVVQAMITCSACGAGLVRLEPDEIAKIKKANESR